jgi:peptidoglycan hydrolase-like protein with peptidoglycan-binding domain
MLMRTAARHALVTLSLALCAAAPALAQEPAPAEEPYVEVDPAAAGDFEMSMEEVQLYQETLKELGYFFGPADGRKGPRTRTALRNFQRDQGLAVTGSLDVDTLRRIDEQAQIARTATRPEPVVPVAPAGSYGGGGDNVFKKVGGGLKTGVLTAGKGVGVAGKSVGTAGKVTGEAVGTAGEATGKAAAKAGVATADASVTAARAVAGGTTTVYRKTKQLFVGDDRTSDEEIRRAIAAQYVDDDRIDPGEVDIQVVKGNVTLALPEGARTDSDHATRLARLTPGVRSVTTIYVAVVPQGGQ